MQPVQDPGEPAPSAGRGTPLWNLGTSLKCRSRWRGPLRAVGAHDQADREQGITPYRWVGPEEAK
jgi:hypothetical protein